MRRSPGRLKRAAKRLGKGGATRNPRARLAADAAALELAPRIIALRRQGYRIAEIAARVSKSVGYVCELLQDAREEWTEARIAETDKLIQAELIRLDQLEAEITERMDGTQNPIAFAALAGRRGDCLERRAKLLGLDRPTRHDVALPGVEQALAGLTPERRAELARAAVQVLEGGAAEPAPGA